MIDNLPEWATQIDKVIYVKTAADALAVLDFLPDDGYDVVIEDGEESRNIMRLLKGMGLR